LMRRNGRPLRQVVAVNRPSRGSFADLIWFEIYASSGERFLFVTALDPIQEKEHVSQLRT
jgi:hypothetical protein